MTKVCAQHPETLETFVNLTREVEALRRKSEVNEAELASYRKERQLSLPVQTSVFQEEQLPGLTTLTQNSSLDELRAYLFPPLRDEAKAREVWRRKRGNLVFFKTHKTGSTTLGSIFFRFGARHGRTFLYGPGHYLNPKVTEPEYRNVSHISISHHTVLSMSPAEIFGFYETYIRDPVYVSILRDPVDRHLSSFRYFVEPNAKDSSLKRFLHDRTYYNQQCKDFGIGSTFQLTDFLQSPDLEGRMTLVLITEYFDEGLVMLKRRLNWELEDILYIRLLDSCSSLKNHKGRGVKCGNPPESYTPEIRGRIKLVNALDQRLYDHFLAKFMKDLAGQDSGFFEELALFRRLREALQIHCEDTVNAFRISRLDALLYPSACTKYAVDDAIYGHVIRSNRGVGNIFLPGERPLLSEDFLTP